MEIKVIRWIIFLLFGSYCKCDPISFIEKAGFKGETHIVVTEDGYNLAMHRIVGPKKSTAVFLQHGFLGSSMDWLVTPKDQSLAFILAEMNYDVWLGNFRGSSFSRVHNKWTTSDTEFWDFSFHEMGVQDLPTMITYIADYKRDTILYIGFSLGTTAFYVMASEKPAILSNIRASVNMAPAIFMSNIKIKELLFLSKHIKFVKIMLGKKMFPGPNLKQNCNILSYFGSDICIDATLTASGCSKHHISDIKKVYTYFPSGTSTKTVYHLAQKIQSKEFRQYDYGSGNMQKYKKPDPPEYNIKGIQIPNIFFYSEYDNLSTKEDIKMLKDQLSISDVRFFKIEEEFCHLDFSWGSNAVEIVYKHLIEVLSEY